MSKPKIYIVLGRSYHYWNTEKYVHKSRDELISYIAYYVYCYKMKCKNMNAVFNRKGLKLYITNKLTQLNKVSKMIDISLYHQTRMLIINMKHA